MLTEPEPAPAPHVSTPTQTADRAEAASPATLTVEVVADSDTRWKWGAGVANTLRAEGPVTVHGHLLQGRATPNDRQLADVGASAASVRRVGIANLLADLADTDADVVVLSCVGGTIQSLLHGLARVWSGRPIRPIVVTGYVGLVYEKVVDGLLLRAGADVLLANSAHDAREFRTILEAVGGDPDTIVQTALPFLGGATYDPSAAGSTRPFTLAFVAQPSVPVTREERVYVLEQAVEHARRRPERNVVLKLRGRPGEQTTHIERWHYAELLAKMGPAPDNLELAYGSMAAVLDRTDLCVTVSSTAALEAMHRQIPTAILTDLGVRETLGNHAFLQAGVYTTWSALHDGTVPKTDEEWAADNGVLDPAPHAAVQRRIAELVVDRTQLPPLRPWFAAAEAVGYLPALLERNGLRPDGGPLMGDERGGGILGFFRRVMRAAAGYLYGISISKIEPRIRKWMQL